MSKQYRIPNVLMELNWWLKVYQNNSPLYYAPVGSYLSTDGLGVKWTVNRTKEVSFILEPERNVGYPCNWNVRRRHSSPNILPPPTSLYLLESALPFGHKQCRSTPRCQGSTDQRRQWCHSLITRFYILYGVLFHNRFNVW